MDNKEDFPTKDTAEVPKKKWLWICVGTLSLMVLTAIIIVIAVVAGAEGECDGKME